ncbi:hypothetical protein CK203_095206 [Vitis vinifera]|uniref:Uncharacterized protein n=1 Tax=Vitis vinifera TaxID=29760 RepID=A0A438E128_VITVI|nr:hypothetical protein CK203_095206 [Vitis vinifera]
MTKKRSFWENYGSSVQETRPRPIFLRVEGRRPTLVCKRAPTLGGTSPFATHPKTMRFAIGCLLAYCMVYGAELSFASSPGSTLYAHAFRRGMMLFGSLSVASLASIFLGDTLQWVAYMLYTLLWMGKLLYSLAPMLYRLSEQVEALVRLTWDRCRGLSIFRAPLLGRHTSRHRGNILPL